MAAMACLPALSQTRMANRGIGVEDVSVTRDGGYVMLNMKLNLDSLDLPTNTRLVYTPVIKTKEGQVEMPEIVINGRRQQIMYERGDMKKDGATASRRQWHIRAQPRLKTSFPTMMSRYLRTSAVAVTALTATTTC